MRRAFILALTVALSGCTAIAPFDFTIGGDASVDDGGPLPDGGPPPDAPPGADAGDVDGGTTSRCPTPCLGDLVEDFTPMEQGVGPASFRFVQDERGPLGLDVAPLSWGSHDGMDAFVSLDPPPAIARCGPGGAGICAGLDGYLALLSDPAGSGSDAAIELTAPDDGRYRIVAEHRAPDGAASAAAHRWRVSRRSSLDAIEIVEFVPQASPRPFEIDVDLFAGETVRVTLASDASAPVANGLAAWLTSAPDTFPGDCQIYLDFDGAEPFGDRCSGTTWENRTDGVADPDPGGSTEVASVDAGYGMARAFVEGQFLHPTLASMDYDGDFTVQMWARVDETQIWTDGYLYADATTDEPSPGGVYLFVDDSGIGYGSIWRDASCTEAGNICSQYDYLTTRPTDGGWHFYRLVRDAAADELRLCIDGRVVSTVPVPGAVDLESGYLPRIGRNVVFNPAYFYGAIDEVRVVSRALPCET